MMITSHQLDQWFPTTVPRNTSVPPARLKCSAKNPYWACLYWSYVAFRHFYNTIACQLLYWYDAAYRLVWAVDPILRGTYKSNQCQIKISGVPHAGIKVRQSLHANIHCLLYLLRAPASSHIILVTHKTLFKCSS